MIMLFTYSSMKISWRKEGQEDLLQGKMNISKSRNLLKNSHNYKN